MKTILSKSKQDQFINDNWKLTTLEFKWGKTGYHNVSLLDKRDNKIGYAGGCGYDKKGSAFGQFLNTYFNEELKKINSSDYYGLNHYNKTTKKFQKFASKNTKTYVDGACGFDCMTRILNKIGFNVSFVKESKWTSLYILEALPKNHYSRKNNK